MSLFRRIFSSKSKSDQKKNERHSDDRSKYMPEINLPVDERFMINFKRNGGKFLYCDNENEVLDSFDKILIENDWYEKDVCCFEIGLEHKFSEHNLNFVKKYSKRHQKVIMKNGEEVDLSRPFLENFKEKMKKI